MDSKHARESLESGGYGTSCRCSNGRKKVAAVLLIHSLLIAACAALILNVYLREPSGSSIQHDTGIYMQMLDFNSDELEFTVIWNHEVDLQDKKRLKLSYAGPYMVYLWACVEDISTDVNTVVNLTMEQGTNSFHLQTLRGTECKEMQKVIMLSEKDEIIVKRYVEDIRFINIRLFLGLHYMLGAQHFPYPLQDPKPVKQLG